MVKEFTYVGDLSTALDYARWRLADTDALVSVDETGGSSPYLWDATYNALFLLFGVQEGMAQACGQIAVKLSQDVTSFGESPGVRFSFANADYYQELADVIRSEPPYSADEVVSVVRSGQIAAGGLGLPFQNLRLEEERPGRHWGGARRLFYD